MGRNLVNGGGGGGSGDSSDGSAIDDETGGVLSDEDQARLEASRRARQFDDETGTGATDDYEPRQDDEGRLRDALREGWSAAVGTVDGAQDEGRDRARAGLDRSSDVADSARETIEAAPDRARSLADRGGERLRSSVSSAAETGREVASEAAERYREGRDEMQRHDTGIVPVGDLGRRGVATATTRVPETTRRGREAWRNRDAAAAGAAVAGAVGLDQATQQGGEVSVPESLDRPELTVPDVGFGYRPEVGVPESFQTPELTVPDVGFGGRPEVSVPEGFDRPEVGVPAQVGSIVDQPTPGGDTVSPDSPTIPTQDERLAHEEATEPEFDPEHEWFWRPEGIAEQAEQQATRDIEAARSELAEAYETLVGGTQATEPEVGPFAGLEPDLGTDADPGTIDAQETDVDAGTDETNLGDLMNPGRTDFDVDVPPWFGYDVATPGTFEYPTPPAYPTEFGEPTVLQPEYGYPTAPQNLNRHRRRRRLWLPPLSDGDPAEPEPDTGFGFLEWFNPMAGPADVAGGGPPPGEPPTDGPGASLSRMLGGW